MGKHVLPSGNVSLVQVRSDRAHWFTFFHMQSDSLILREIGQSLKTRCCDTGALIICGQFSSRRIEEGHSHTTEPTQAPWTAWVFYRHAPNTRGQGVRDCHHPGERGGKKLEL